MYAQKKYYKIVFLLTFVIFLFFSVNVLIKGEVYNRDFELSEITRLDSKWSYINDGELISLDFPFKINIKQNEVKSFYYIVGDEVNKYQNPSIRLYKYYADIIVKIDNKVAYTSVNQKESISNTKGLGYLVIDIPKKIGSKIEVSVIGTMNGDFTYNLEAPLLGDKESLYYDMLYNVPITIYLNVFILSVGLFIMIMGFIVRKIDRKNSFLNLGFFSFAFSTYMIISTRWFHGFFPNIYLGYVLEYTFLIILTWPPLILIIDEVDRWGKKFAIGVLIYEISLLWISYLSLYFFRIEFANFLPLIHIGLILSILSIGIAGISSYRDNNIIGIRLIKSFIPLSIGIMMDLLLYNIFEFNNFRTYFTEIGLVLFLVFQFYYVYGNYIKAIREKYRSEIYRKIAYNDQLTGVGSRAAFTKELLNIENNKTKLQDLWAVCVDLNDLKYYNDTFGHAMGDKMLLSLSIVLKSSLSKNDLLFRTGGDEFIIFLSGYGLNEIKNYHKSLEEIRKRYCQINNIEFSFAIGYSKFNSNKDKSFENTINRADAKMYQNKKEMKAKKH